MLCIIYCHIVILSRACVRFCVFADMKNIFTEGRYIVYILIICIHVGTPHAHSILLYTLDIMYI